MVGKVKKKNAPTKTEKKVNATSTHEEKLADTVKRMGNIVSNKDQRHHLK